MGNGFTRQSFSMPLVMLEDLKREAEERDMSMSQVLRHYLRLGALGKQQGGLDLLRRKEGNVDDRS